MSDKIIVDCDKRIELNDYSYIKSITGNILDFNQNNDDVKGNINLNIKFYDNSNTLKENNEIIPFDVTLLNEKKIDNLKVVNLNYYEIVNQGIQCNYQIEIYLVDKEEIKITETNNEEINELETENEDYIDDVCPLEEEIKEKYDELLDEIFNGAEENIEEDIKDNFEVVEEVVLESYPKDVTFNINTNDRDTCDKSNRINFDNIKESFAKYIVYYPKEENEIDKLCNLENVSITNVYNSQFNKEFSKKKRIIIEK